MIRLLLSLIQVETEEESGRALPLSTLGMQHWEEALVDPRLDPQVVLVDVGKVRFALKDF